MFVCTQLLLLLLVHLSIYVAIQNYRFISPAVYADQRSKVSRFQVCPSKFPRSEIPAFQSSRIPAFPCSAIQGSPPFQCSAFQSSQVPAFPCSAIPGSLPFQCSAFQSSQVPAFPCSAISGSLPFQCSAFQSSQVPAFPCSAIPGSLPFQCSAIQSSQVPAFPCSAISGSLPFQCSAFQSSEVPKSQSSPLQSLAFQGSAFQSFKNPTLSTIVGAFFYLILDKSHCVYDSLCRHIRSDHRSNAALVQALLKTPSAGTALADVICHLITLLPVVIRSMLNVILVRRSCSHPSTTARLLIKHLLVVNPKMLRLLLLQFTSTTSHRRLPMRSLAAYSRHLPLKTSVRFYLTTRIISTALPRFR